MVIQSANVDRTHTGTAFSSILIPQIQPYNQPGTWQFPGQLKDAWSSALIPCMEQLQYQHQPLRIDHMDWITNACCDDLSFVLCIWKISVMS